MPSPASSLSSIPPHRLATQSLLSPPHANCSKVTNPLRLPKLTHSLNHPHLLPSPLTTQRPRPPQSPGQRKPPHETRNSLLSGSFSKTPRDLQTSRTRNTNNSFGKPVTTSSS